MERRKQVKQVLVEYVCPKCKEGTLKPTGMVLTSYPPQYPHTCTNSECDYMETFMDKTYPYLDYEPVEEDKEHYMGLE